MQNTTLDTLISGISARKSEIGGPSCGKHFFPLGVIDMITSSMKHDDT